MENYNGALLDTRPQVEREKDFRFEETVASVAPVKWYTKTPAKGLQLDLSNTTWRRFPIFDQDGSGSCVAQTGAKLMGIMYWLKNPNDGYVHFSATHLYQRRNNKPNSGMAGVDAFKVMQEGVTLEQLTASQNMSDAAMDNAVVQEYKQEVGRVFKIGNYLTLPIKDIETVASVIQQTKKGVMVWFYFSSGLKPRDWKAVPEIMHPSLPLSGNDTARHSIAAVDFTLLSEKNLPKLYSKYYGKKAIICDESWGLDKDVQDVAKITDSIITVNGQHIITEDFFKVRNFFAAYPINFKFEENSTGPVPTPGKPKYNFTKNLSYIPWDDNKNQPSNVPLNEAQKADVIGLQNCLRYEGVFPANLGSTGYYGNVTKTAVMDFQRKYNIEVVGEVGPITRAKLNELYNN